MQKLLPASNHITREVDALPACRVFQQSPSFSGQSGARREAAIRVSVPESCQADMSPIVAVEIRIQHKGLCRRQDASPVVPEAETETLLFNLVRRFNGAVQMSAVWSSLFKTLEGSGRQTDQKSRRRFLT